MYCLRCGYNLKVYSKHECPECGASFNPASRRTWGPPTPDAIRHARLEAVKKCARGAWLIVYWTLWNFGHLILIPIVIQLLLRRL